MKYFRYVLIAFVLIISSENVWAQDEAGPVKIKVRRYIFKVGNQYSVYIPNFEFHVLLQKSFDIIRSVVTADYDFRRKDMGFGMSHSLNKFIVNPGVSVDDKLYFREIFNDSTGVWYRKQSITPFLIHQLSKNSTLVMEFNFGREWSPKIRMGTDILSYYDYSVKVHYLYQADRSSKWNDRLFFIAFERSYKIFKGQYNYLLLESLLKYSTEFNRYVRYKGNICFRGNLTPQESPLFFIGGNSTLIGYENDEFWGRRVFYSQNLLELKPFPEFILSISKAEFRRLSLLCQIDYGQTRGASYVKDLKLQTKDLKIGIGIGFGVNTDLPFMPDTDLHFIIGSPSDDFMNVKYYAGFGGWLN